MSFTEKPGLLFVWATLLPLAAFTLLLLLGGLRNFLRPYREQPAWAGLYRFLEHDVAGRGGFYVGFAGIVLAFLCAFSGFCLYQGEQHALEAQIKEKEEEIHKVQAEARNIGKNVHEEVHGLEVDLLKAQQSVDERWSDAMVWAAVRPSGL